MKHCRIFLIFTMVVGLLLSMTACSGANPEVLPEGFDKCAAQLGLHKTSVPEKLGYSIDALVYDQYNRSYELPESIEYHGLTFQPFLSLQEDNKMLYSFYYVSDTIATPKEAAQKLSSISRAFAGALGDPIPSNNSNGTTLFHTLTVEELEALLAAPQEVYGSNRWNLGFLSTEETAALRSYMVQLDYERALGFPLYPEYMNEPALIAELFIRCVEDGHAVIRLSFSLTFQKSDLE